jgi:hypothetical protein
MTIASQSDLILNSVFRIEILEVDLCPRYKRSRSRVG